MLASETVAKILILLIICYGIDCSEHGWYAFLTALFIQNKFKKQFDLWVSSVLLTFMINILQWSPK